MKIVDARGLQHPEPFERAVEALTELALGDQMKLIIHQEPRPVYRFLERNRYGYKAKSVEQAGALCRMSSLSGLVRSVPILLPVPVGGNAGPTVGPR